MSFNIEGSRDGVCRDELDLGQQDEDLRPVTNGQVRNGDHDPSEEADKGTIAKDESQYTAEGDERVSRQDGSLILSGSEEILSIQHYLPEDTVGAAGETASIPDNTPSLHVCAYIDLRWLLLLLHFADCPRDLFNQHQAAAHLCSNGLLESVLARRTVLLIFGSSLASPHRYLETFDQHRHI
jgi:hypothetical protein